MAKNELFISTVRVQYTPDLMDFIYQTSGA